MGPARMPGRAFHRGRVAARLPLVLGAIALASLTTGLVHAEIDLRAIASDLGANSLAEQLAATETARERVDAETRALDARAAAARARLIREVRALYRLTRPGAAPVAAGFDGLRAHVARVKRLERLVTGQVAEIAGVASERQRLRAERERLDAELSDARSRVEDLRARDDHAAFAPAYAAPIGASEVPGGGSFYGLRIIDGPPVDPFAARKGNLASPVTGEVRVVDATSMDGHGAALRFQASAGTPVRAAAPGRVAFSDRREGYGRLVMVDHGDGFSTVYAGLGGVEVLVGDDLSQGARIGSVGGDEDPPALRFEVRRGDRALAPRAWLGF
jgi:murein DD-endopeptidase MepM/ murein hydrolase activator NlpD